MENYIGKLRFDKNQVPLKRFKYCYEIDFKPEGDLYELLKEYTKYDQEYYVILEAIANSISGDTKIGKWKIKNITELFGGRHSVRQTLSILSLPKTSYNIKLLHDYGFNSIMDKKGRNSYNQLEDVRYYIENAPLIIDARKVAHYISILGNWEFAKAKEEVSMYNGRKIVTETAERMAWENHPHMYLLPKSRRIRIGCQAALNRKGIKDPYLHEIHNLIGLVDEVPECIRPSFEKFSKEAHKYVNFADM